MENISDDDVVEVLNIFCKEITNCTIAHLKKEVLKKPMSSILGMDDVIKVMNKYDIKYKLEIEYVKVGANEKEVRESVTEIPDGIVGLKKSVVERSMEAQKKEIDNPEVQEIVDNIKPIAEEVKVSKPSSAFPSPPDFL